LKSGYPAFKVGGDGGETTMDELAGDLGYIVKLIAAAGALGTAAFGLVDASKAFWGGMSNPGFGYIRKAVETLLATAGGAAAFGRTEIMATLRANWLNGVPKAVQKATAKSLIHLMLTPETAPAMAAAVGVNADHLTLAARHIQNDEAVTEQDMRVLGTYDVMASAVLDFGYERADQFYRNTTKLAAAGCAIVLAVAARWLMDGTFNRDSLLMAAIVGVVATPLAPIAKDLATSLTTAAKAVGALKR
jgi:hypothetical protein